MFTLLKRAFRSGWKSLARDGGLVAANIFIMAMVIAMITSLFIFKDASDFLIEKLQEKVDISVYFKYETAEEDILKVKDEITNIPQVREVEYISKEEAFKRFTEKHQDNTVLMESLSEVGTNPFLASLDIKAFQANQYEAVATFLDDSNFDYLIEKVDYHERKPVIERIFALTSNFNKAGIVFSIILAIVAILVAFNTIRLAIYNSREEIKIQRLVGASNRFIRGPFLVQGAVCGFAAALICLLLFLVLTWGFNSKVEYLFPGLSLFQIFVGNFWLILLIQITAGVGLGMLSSLIAVRRYLRV
ncbi:MAG: permease-like cell division protein FtsX [Candidatus Pacebacteria bacterium]|nr:permease-like cell division protein FtsX [Candidatus Paceibacterota bacterium]